MKNPYCNSFCSRGFYFCFALPQLPLLWRGRGGRLRNEKYYGATHLAFVVNNVATNIALLCSFKKVRSTENICRNTQINVQQRCSSRASLITAHRNIENLNRLLIIPQPLETGSFIHFIPNSLEYVLLMWLFELGHARTRKVTWTRGDIPYLNDCHELFRVFTVK